MYQTVKTFHLMTVVISLSLFFLRFFIYYAKSQPVKPPKLLKILPHINDSLLLCSGVALISITKFVPFTPAAPWLTYKLGALLMYIVFGYLAMKPGSSLKNRVFFFIAAMVSVLAILTLALNKHLALALPY
ncbi:SirB2 family protein [Vibrio sp. SCSIO 43137]|uniref:SirB2 family protein n=1 Tax=Vibrio sp. SCSIO 43137 TaxID=3021011 RepID=UPI002306F79A|nr:SirB2 family protein [Vibrio sp. SCSIO 43137]WCE31593.1 SirB2 family protein [Vibrio sp. SCSIO 43137]